MARVQGNRAFNGAITDDYYRAGRGRGLDLRKLTGLNVSWEERVSILVLFFFSSLRGRGITVVCWTSCRDVEGGLVI